MTVKRTLKCFKRIQNVQLKFIPEFQVEFLESGILLPQVVLIFRNHEQFFKGSAKAQLYCSQPKRNKWHSLRDYNTNTLVSRGHL